jgi:hypothetical protein
MIALTRDFHIFASGVTTGFSAVFFSIRYNAQARQVRAHLGLLIRHYDFRPFQVYFPIPAALRFLHSDFQTHVAAGTSFQGVPRGGKTERNLKCRRADSASVFGRSRGRDPSDRREVPSKFEDPTLLSGWIYLSVGPSIDWNRTCTRRVRELGQSDAGATKPNSLPPKSSASSR